MKKKLWRAFLLLMVAVGISTDFLYVADAAEASVSGEQGVITDSVTGMQFIFVKGGCFNMGDTFGDGEKNEAPVHEVCVPDLYVGKYEVTQSQWKKVMGNNPASQIGCGPECPVENVSWITVQEFIGKLNSKGGSQYRLPTEAEWEYAARSGGKKEKWAGTSDEDLLGSYAWYDKNSDTATHRVGTRRSNSLGLYDMSGNVLEWCQDWYSEDYYGVSPKNNPSGPSSGQKRVLRGGLYASEPKDLRVSRRVGDDIDVRDGSNGFRLVRAVK